MISNIRAFFGLSFKDKVLFFEALVLLFLVKFLFSVLPFKSCIRTFRKETKNKSIDTEQLIRIKLALARANHLAFWGNVCLVSSFAGKWMLQRRGIGSELFIGVNVGDKEGFRAHAWLKAGGVEITHEGG
jgi:hypothetical protein